MCNTPLPLPVASLHGRLCQDASGNRHALNLFYEAWRLEHRMCTTIPWGACQMSGQQLQNFKDASHSDSESEAEKE